MSTSTAPPTILGLSSVTEGPALIVVRPGSETATFVRKTLSSECPASAKSTMAAMNDWIRERIKREDLASLVPADISVLVFDNLNAIETALRLMLTDDERRTFDHFAPTYWKEGDVFYLGY